MQLTGHFFDFQRKCNGLNLAPGLLIIRLKKAKKKLTYFPQKVTLSPGVIDMKLFFFVTLAAKVSLSLASFYQALLDTKTESYRYKSIQHERPICNPHRKQHFAIKAECQILFIAMLFVIILNVVGPLKKNFSVICDKIRINQ